MEHLKRLSVALLILIALPSTAQEDESASFFSVSSNRTFAPGGKPVIQVWGQRVRRLHFRLYRVQDPRAFFLRLEDDHNFGGQPPRRAAQAVTTLEKLRRWKRQARLRASGLVRAQFTSDARARYRDWRESRPLPGATTSPAEFASVPLLNSQQLVSTWDQTFRSPDPWVSATVPVPAPGKGLYLVEATDGRLQAYTIVSVTDIAVITKIAPGRLLGRVVHRDTGAPVAGASYLVYGHNKKSRYGEGRTRADGFFEVKATDAKPENALVLVQAADGFAAVSVFGSGLATDPDAQMTGYVYTDRPVYRPGHTVHYRLVFRTRQPSGYAVPSGREALVEIQDSDGQAVHRNRLRLSAMGSAHGSFTIPAAAPLGHYVIQISVGEASGFAYFQVEEYRKPEYEVRVIPETPRLVQGLTASVRIEARYFHGEPVALGKVTYAVHRSRWWPPYFLEEQQDEPDPRSEEDTPYEDRDQLKEIQGSLDGEGRWTVSLPTESLPHDVRYRIEARVTDAAGREISGAGFVVATVGPYLIRVRADNFIYSPADRARLSVESLDYDGNPAPAKPFSIEWSEYRQGREAAPLLGQQQSTTGAAGKTTVEIPLQTGYLRVVARSRTPEGRLVEDVEYLWVTGSGAWSSFGQRIEIVPDKKSYQPGDTARLLIVTGQPGTHLWLTVEGRAIHESRFIDARESTVRVDIPVRAEYAPNFFVTAAGVRSNTFLQGVKSVRVPPTDKKLDVELRPAKAEYTPGEPGAYVLEARDAAGNPVAAEFSVGVVDEALYAVRPDRTQDILAAFYGREWNHVSTDTSLTYHFHGEAGRRRMPLAQVRPAGARAQLKPERLVQPRIRKAFPDTAFWSANVRTASNGRAEVRLTYPDALTTWRATARGITGDTRVGSAVVRAVVRKNLLVRVAAPRFFRQGDSLTLTLIAQNLLPSEKRVRVSLEANHLNLTGPASTELTIPPRATGTVDYQVRVPAGREAVLVAKALTDEESDALELTVPIQPYGVRMSQASGGTLAGGAATEAAFAFPADAEPSSRRLTVSVSPSVGATILEALDFLTTYPYGCTEQTLSSLVPNVLVSKAAREPGFAAAVDQASLDRKVRAGLDRLFDFQHEDGGWGWWKTDASSAFMTAYALAGLLQAKAAGINVPAERIQRAAQWLSADAGIATAPLDLQVYSAYALALTGRKDAARLDSLYLHRSGMNPLSLALLGLAMRESGDRRSAEIASALEAVAKTGPNDAYWESARDDMLDIEVDNNAEATAFALKFLVREKPASGLVPKAAFYLANRRDRGGYWSSTKQTAMVLYGLIDYWKLSGELKPDFTVTVTLDGRAVLARRFTPRDSLAPVTIEISPEQLASASSRIRVTTQGEGRLYWSATSVWHSNQDRRSQGGLEIDRQYFRLVPVSESGRIVHALQPLGALRLGDVVAVHLRVNAASRRYLMIEDPIPAGTEIIPRDDLYQIADRPPWWVYGFTGREFRDDRAVFFQGYSQPRSTYFYLLKVITPGRFRVSPARVEPMYQPRDFATSQAQEIEVER